MIALYVTLAVAVLLGIGAFAYWLRGMLAFVGIFVALVEIAITAR